MAKTVKPPTRDQLSKFLPDKESLRKFEELFNQSAADTNDIEQILIKLQEAYVTASIIGSSADQANASISELTNTLSNLVGYQADQPANKINADYIDFPVASPHAIQARRLFWDDTNSTLNIAMSAGYVYTAGLELLSRVINVSGATLQAGKVIGLSGVGTGGPVTGQYFIANGTLFNGSLLGIAPIDIPNNTLGLVLSNGRLLGTNTTGSQYGETWLAGDPLYASPFVAGAITKVKPTAPNVVIPLGIVGLVHAANGLLAIRPSTSPPLYYGDFYNTTNLTQAAINTPLAITFNNTTISSGVSIGSPTSRIVTAFSGVYDFKLTIQANKTSASIGYLWVWIRKNGTDISNSALKYAIQGNSAETVISRVQSISMGANDYIEIMWAVDSTSINLFSDAPTVFAPSVPSATLSANQINQ